MLKHTDKETFIAIAKYTLDPLYWPEAYIIWDKMIARNLVEPPPREPGYYWIETKLSAGSFIGAARWDGHVWTWGTATYAIIHPTDIIAIGAKLPDPPKHNK